MSERKFVRIYVIDFCPNGDNNDDDDDDSRFGQRDSERKKREKICISCALNSDTYINEFVVVTLFEIV